MVASQFEVVWKRDLRRKVQAQIRAAAVRGVTNAADALLTDANETVPHDKGTLQRSGHTSTDETKIAAAASYDTPYAVRQHEDTSLHHIDGRRAKWLQLTLQENAQRYKDYIARTIKEAGG